MAPPSGKAIEAALIQSTCEVWKDDPDNTSVNKVRQHVEEKLDLEEGFLSNGNWKQKSKSLIKEYVNKLLDGWNPDADKTAKRQSSEPQSPKAKRQKRSAKPVKPLAEDADDENDPEEKKAPTKGKPAARQAKPPKSGDDDDASKGNENTPLEEDGGQDEVEKSINDEADEPPKDIVEEDEYSDVIDEPLPTKRKKGQKKEPTAKAPKQSKATTTSTSTSEDPQEAEIKKLQSQLGKCGVRKLWHNELKQYGTDARAKIRHLKKMLADIGMEGRFSEAKAREIRETRELLADAEAAQEMDRLWGTGTGTRASRSKSKNMKVDDSDGSGPGEAEDEESDEENTFAARRKRAQADLAFLGDESDSD